MLRKRKSVYLVFLSILLISIGFAYLSSNLGIIGNTSVKARSWDIYFDNVTVTNESVTAETQSIIENKTSVKYKVNLLTPGDEYEFSVDAVNNGTLDAMVKSISNTGLTPSQKKYLEYYVTYDNLAPLEEKDYLKNKSHETYRVIVRYKKDIEPSDLPEEDQEINLTFSVEYEYADTSAKERKNFRVIEKNGETLATGDEVAISTEHFYVVSTNSEKTVLLAKYNLYVGNIYSEGRYGENMVKEGEISTAESGYCLQNENAIGFIDYNNKRIGVLDFSGTNYWYDDSELKSKYGESYNESNVYDENYDEVSGENYSIAYYVKEYVEKLKQMGASNIKGRLLTHHEAEDLGCSEFTCKTVIEKNKFVYSTDYWLGSAYSNYTLWYIHNEGGMHYHNYFLSFSRGLRPVIEIPTSKI